MTPRRLEHQVSVDRAAQLVEYLLIFILQNMSLLYTGPVCYIFSRRMHEVGKLLQLKAAFYSMSNVYEQKCLFRQNYDKNQEHIGTWGLDSIAVPLFTQSNAEF